MGSGGGGQGGKAGSTCRDGTGTEMLKWGDECRGGRVGVGREGFL